MFKGPGIFEMFKGPGFSEWLFGPDEPQLKPEPEPEPEIVEVAEREARLKGLRNKLGDAMHDIADFVQDGQAVPQELRDRAELLRRQINVLSRAKD